MARLRAGGGAAASSRLPRAGAARCSRSRRRRAAHDREVAARPAACRSRDRPASARRPRRWRLSTTRAPPPPPTAKCRSPKASRATSTGAEVAAALGQHVFVARRPLAVEAPLEHARVSTSAASRRVSMFERDAEALLELVEPRHAGEGVAQDQHAPPLADLLEAAGDRAGHVGEALALHGRHHSRVTCIMKVTCARPA